VAREEVDRVGMGDERPRPVDQARDRLRDRQAEAGAQAGGDHRVAHRGLARAARERERRDQQPQEQDLRGVGVGDERILQPVVMGEEEVEVAQQRQVHGSRP
jgi:hypothetical protein